MYQEPQNLAELQSGVRNFCGDFNARNICRKNKQKTKIFCKAKLRHFRPTLCVVCRQRNSLLKVSYPF